MHLSRKHDYPSFHVSDALIEVWCVEASAPESVIRQLKSVLSADERERAARFKFERDRNAFIVARGVLRVSLARYLGASPAEVDFVYGPKGKPSLPDSRIEFNISHTDRVVLLAFSQGCALGVDVECVRLVQDMMQIARRNFCLDEALELEGLPEEKRQRAFFRCWTRKESYIKATGNGLSTPLSEFRVAFKEGQTARFVHIGNDPSAASAWVLHDLDVSPDYAAAIAYRGETRQIAQSLLLPVAQLTESAY
jgi:4'-phosphopantetheinyl transferase